MKILTVVGARPQFIKAAVLSRAIAHLNSGSNQSVSEIIVHTGQHHDNEMSEIFFEELGLPAPDYNLSVRGGSHGAMTGRMLESCEGVLLKEQPDVVVVYGDTNSTLAGALAAAKLHIPVAHVEAGLRSFNSIMPEEMNRILTDKISTFLFCPCDSALQNLKVDMVDGKVGDMPGKNWLSPVVCVSGDVMLDSYMHYSRKHDLYKVAERIVGQCGSYVLFTVHRAENTDNRLRFCSIVDAINQLSKTQHVVWPLHPRAKKMVDHYQLKLSRNIQIVSPQGYISMLALERSAALIITDSGGVQKEAYFSGTPCLILREETEWLELVDCGWSTLVGGDLHNLANIASRKANVPILPERQDIYGDGSAGEKVLRCLVEELA